MSKIYKMYEIENDENNSNVNSFITVMIGIIFCLIVIIFLTIFDFYKKPSLYELELLNEYKKLDCNQPEECKESDTSSNNIHKKNKRWLSIYEDILYLIGYIIVLYLISLTYLPEPVIGFIAILLILLFLKIKNKL